VPAARVAALLVAAALPTLVPRPALGAATPAPGSPLIFSGPIAGPMAIIPNGVDCTNAQGAAGVISVVGDIRGTRYVLTVSPPNALSGEVAFNEQTGNGDSYSSDTTGITAYDPIRGFSIDADLDAGTGTKEHVSGTATCEVLPTPTPGGSRSSSPTTAAGSSTSGSSGAAAPAASSTPWLPVVLGLAFLAVVMAGVLVWRRRRPATAGTAVAAGASRDRILDVSRRLSSAYAADEMARAVVREAMSLVPSDLGGLIRNSGGAISLAHESHPGTFDPARLGEGMIERAVSTGQPIVAVAATEPAIRQSPVAVLIIPLVINGAVAALLVLLRAEANAFTAPDRDLLMSLAPVAAAAIENADATRAMIEQNLTDQLTGVGNRRRLDEEGGGLVSGARPEPTTVLMLDLDHFKAVNDTHGHPAGDELLRSTAQILRSTVRPGDRVYRYGGEEFCIVMPGAQPPAAAQICTRLLTAVAGNSVRSGTAVITATVSIGVAVSPVSDVTELIKQADAALYRAKEGGRNRAVLDTPPGRPELPAILGPTPAPPLL
jgi:diguanylate cyclase (GGDEF)-like protein